MLYQPRKAEGTPTVLCLFAVPLSTLPVIFVVHLLMVVSGTLTWEDLGPVTFDAATLSLLATLLMLVLFGLPAHMLLRAYAIRQPGAYLGVGLMLSLLMVVLVEAGLPEYQLLTDGWALLMVLGSGQAAAWVVWLLLGRR